MNPPAELIRASILHTPQSSTLVAFEDGGLLISEGRVAACGDFSVIREQSPRADVLDWRGSFVLPGFVDTHVHYPQLAIIGALGRALLDWLEQVALPEESRMADVRYAGEIADGFVQALASHGTTTALVFGAHFSAATASLFEAAGRSGLRIASGLVLSDRNLRPELHHRPESAYQESAELIRRYHGNGNLRYAVTPRFALSTSEAMLEVCQTLLSEHPDVLLQTHINENLDEVRQLTSLVPWAEDYLSVYERFALVGTRSVLAHSVHSTDHELSRLATYGASVAHCPSSNAMLGSGSFPLRRHMAAKVHCALGTDVGGGSGFGMVKEGLQAYLTQRLRSDGVMLDAGNLLYLTTLAGAEALGLQDQIGDFTVGKAADLVRLRPPENSVVHKAVNHAATASDALASLYTLAGQECVAEVRVAGGIVYRAQTSELSAPRSGPSSRLMSPSSKS